MSNNFNPTIQAVIDHIESTSEDEWQMGTCRSKDQKKNCVMGHIFNMGKTDAEGNDWWDWFEACFATTYMIFPVNDGEDSRYPQATPKQRCLAYLRDLASGHAKTTNDYQREYENQVSSPEAKLSNLMRVSDFKFRRDIWALNY